MGKVKTIDYKTWSDEQLNREVASRRGFRIYRSDLGRYALRDENGADYEGGTITAGFKYYTTEDEAWKQVPNYAGDLNLAWGLAADLIRMDMGWSWIQEYSSETARAACALWLEVNWVIYTGNTEDD